MTPRTHQFTREQMVEHARKVAGGHQSVANICKHREDLGVSTQYEADVMEAIAAVLENYPLANPAAECVRIICEDLAQRGGFSEVIAQIGPSAWRDIREYLTAKLANTVVYTTPEPKAEEVEMEFA